MRAMTRACARLLPLLLGGALLTAPANGRADGVTVALVPGTSTVDPGSTFELDLQVTEAGDAFNAFDAVIGWDPAAVTFVPMAPISLQLGSLLTGACANPPFHRFRQGASSDTIGCSLLCQNVALTGPGQLYRLQFRASDTAQITHVRFLPGLQFYNAGLYVDPAHATDAVIGIGVAVDAGAPAPRADLLRLRAAPNPARGGTVFTIEAGRAGPQRLLVFDLRGRAVRSFADTMAAPGSRTVAWDGRDAAGRPLPAGVYVVRLEAAGRSATSRVTLLP